MNNSKKKKIGAVALMVALIVSMLTLPMSGATGAMRRNQHLYCLPNHVMTWIFYAGGLTEVVNMYPRLDH